MGKNRSKGAWRKIAGSQLEKLPVKVSLKEDWGEARKGILARSKKLLGAERQVGKHTVEQEKVL